jgi:hypothetical protein
MGAAFAMKAAARPPHSKGGLMCPACLASLAMIVAGTASTGGVAAVLMHKFRVKRGAKKMVGVGSSEWTQTKEKWS